PRSRGGCGARARRKDRNQVLAPGLDPVEGVPVELAGPGVDRRAGIGGGGALERPPAERRVEPPRDAVDRVALGHAARLSAGAGAIPRGAGASSSASAGAGARRGPPRRPPPRRGRGPPPATVD